MRKGLVTLRTVVVAGAVAAGVVLRPEAVEGITIKASFAPIRLTARAGQTVMSGYELKVQEGEPRAHFKVQVQDWWRSEDGRQTFYAAPGSVARSCGPWVVATPQETSVAGGETLRVRLTVNVPADAKPGGYWCALSVDETPDPLAAAPGGVEVRFLASVSTGIYVNINPIERGIEITSVEIVDERAVGHVRNTSNTPVVVEGRFEFFRVGDTTPAAVAELPRHVLLMAPYDRGAYDVPLPASASLPAGTYIVRLVLDIGLDHYVGVQRTLEIRRGAVDDPRPVVR